MAEILGLGMTHSPPLAGADANMARILKYVMANERTPEKLRDPANWPEAYRREWETNADNRVAAAHRARCWEGFARIRKALDDFRPDALVIFGDDQYENFREEGVPSFCVFALDEVETRPFRNNATPAANAWHAPPDTVLRTRGHAEAGRYLATALLQEGFDISYAYRMRYEHGLPHAFSNALLFLDHEQRGLDIPVIPFHVNCYGSSTLSKRGAFAHLDGTGSDIPDPPGPNPARCFEIGAAAARAMQASPWRVAMIASSSWSHVFLVGKNHYLWPDMEADRARYAEMRDNQLYRWRELRTAQIEEAGHQELLNWVCLAGAMNELGCRLAWSDLVESAIFNASKCLAIFEPG